MPCQVPSALHSLCLTFAWSVTDDQIMEPAVNLKYNFSQGSWSKQSAFKTGSKVRKLYSHLPSYEGLSSEQSMVGLTHEFTSQCLLLQSTLTSTGTTEALWIPTYSNLLHLSIKLMQFTEDKTFCLWFPMPSSQEWCGRVMTLCAFHLPDTAAEVTPSELLWWPCHSEVRGGEAAGFPVYFTRHWRPGRNKPSFCHWAEPVWLNVSGE